MDVTQALKDTENCLRDVMAVVLSNRFGSEWLTKCSVTEERVLKWQSRKVDEESRQDTGVVEERILYYADFYDLKTILKKNGLENFQQYGMIGKQWRFG